MTNETVSKSKTIFIFVSTIILGFVLFALPNIFLGVFKINGGLSGINLALMGFFQFFSVCTLIHFALKQLHMDFKDIGLKSAHWKTDTLIGLGVTILRAIIDFGFITPNTGGASRPDIQEVITSLDGTTLGLISLIILGVVGGGITEEIYNRGFFITVMKGLFKNEKIGLWISVIVSILFFSAGHLPSSDILWYDILVASSIYTALFLLTGRLTASIISHASWNMLAILIIHYTY